MNSIFRLTASVGIASLLFAASANASLSVVHAETEFTVSKSILGQHVIDLPLANDVRQGANKIGRHTFPYESQAMAEFSLESIGGPVQKAVLCFDAKTLVFSEHFPQFNEREFLLSAYKGNGYANAYDFDRGPVIAELSMANPAFLTPDHIEVDVTEAINYLILHDSEYAGFRFSDPYWTANPYAHDQGLFILDGVKLKLMAVPEPSAIIALVAFGFIGLTLWQKRRRRA